MKTIASLLTFFALGMSTTNAQGIRLILNSGNQSDTTHFVFAPGASVGFDSQTDLYATQTSGNGINYISSGNGSPMHCNYTPLPDSAYSVPVGIFVQNSCMATILIEAEPGIPVGTLFSLEWISASYIIPLTPGVPASLYLPLNSQNDPADYRLHVFPDPQILTTASSCSDSQDGSIQIIFGNSAQWVADIYDAGQNLISTHFVSGNSLTLNGFAGANYIVAVSSGMIEYYFETTTVNAPLPPDASFSLPSDTVMAGDLLLITNNAGSGHSYTWDFGDGSSLQNGMQPNYSYGSPGQYTITQTVSTTAGCTASFMRTIDVFPALTTSLNENTAADAFTLQNLPGQLTIVPGTNKPFTVTVFSIDGKQIAASVSDGGAVGIPVYTAGPVLVSIVSGPEEMRWSKTVFVNN